MQNVTICLFPPFISGLLASGAITPLDLISCEKLTPILSELSVNKIKYLNSPTKEDCDKAINMFKLDILNSYVANNSVLADVQTSVPVYVSGPTLAALSPVGDESMVPVLAKSLHNYSLSFKTYRIKPKLYAVVFEPLHEVSSPTARDIAHYKDMEALVSEIALELSDAELLGEDIYQHFLSLSQSF